MHNRKPSAKNLLKDVLYQHVDLALDLLHMVNSLSTGDRTYRFQIVALIIFLSGVDKTLSLTFELMYLAGKIDWKWLTKGDTPSPGSVECHRGLTAKLEKLAALGLDITDLQWIIDLRNIYIHSCSIYVGYSIIVDDTGAILIFFVFGTLSGLDGPRLAANLPTPWMGVWERINIFSYMLWVVVLAIGLLRTPVERPQDVLGGRPDSG